MIGQKDLLDKNIEDIVKNLNLRKVLNENKEMYTEINYKEKEYTIIYNVIKMIKKNPKYLMILYWIDKTEYLKVKQNYDDEKCNDANTSRWI